MGEGNPFVVDVTETSFDEAVVQRSAEVPVLVDFWAPWCGPCRMLGPVLEELAAERAGQFVLAKVNTEAYPGLGARFGVRSIPAVKLFVRGKVAGEFVGALPGSQVARFLDTHLPSEAATLVAEASALLEAGSRADAREKLREALELEEGLASAHLLLAKLALAEGELDLARHHAEAIRLGRDEHAAAQAVLAATGPPRRRC